MADRHEVERRALSGGQHTDLAACHQSEDIAKGGELPNCTVPMIAQHDGRARYGEGRATIRHHLFRLRLAFFVIVGEECAFGYWRFGNRALARATYIGGADMQEASPRDFRKSHGVARAFDVDCRQFIARRIEFQVSGTMDNEVGLNRCRVQSHQRLRHVPRYDLDTRNRFAIVAAHFAGLAYHGGDASAACRQPGADFAADQSGGSGNEHPQQQEASDRAGLASAWPKGTAVPQPRNTP